MKRCLLLIFLPILVFGAAEPIMLDTVSHKFISPLTVAKEKDVALIPIV